MAKRYGCPIAILAIAIVVTRVQVAESGAKASRKAEADGADLIVLRVAKSQRISNLLDEELALDIKKLPGVRAVDGVLVDLHIFSDQKTACVFGLNPESRLPGEVKILHGRALSDQDKRKISIGRILALSVDKKVGDSLEYCGNKFEIVAIYESRDLVENSGAVMPLREMQDLLAKSRKVSPFHVRLYESHKDAEKIEDLRNRIEKLRLPKGASHGLTVHVNRDYGKT